MRTFRLVVLCFSSCLVCFLRAEVRLDIEYGNSGGVPLLLDANVPDGDGPFPVAILVHGGGWTGGDKAGSDKPGNGADITPWFAPLTEAKFAWFSINYRLAPAHRWPACYDDVRTAIRWVKAHAAEFKGDARRIALFGHSAGGQLVCLAALEADEATRVQAVVGFAPATNFEQDLAVRGGLSPALQGLFGLAQEPTAEALARLRECSPINHARAGAPRFLLVHGTADKSVPFRQSLDFQAKLRAAGGTCDLLAIEGAGHGLLRWTESDPDYMAKAIAWLHATLPFPS